MGRATRTFKLSLSPTGIDALIEAHCHLIRRTRCLLAWGMTLHVAVDHLETIEPSQTLLRLDEIDMVELMGDIVHHVGAPRRLGMLASDIVDRLAAEAPDRAPPTLGAIYILALLQLVEAKPSAIHAAFTRAQAQTPAPCG